MPCPLHLPPSARLAGVLVGLVHEVMQATRSADQQIHAEAHGFDPHTVDTPVTAWWLNCP